LVKNPYIDANWRLDNINDMMIIEITGGMLRAARSLTGLTQEELAARASISRPCLTAWEGSSNGMPNAGVHALHRLVTALQAEGVVFVSGGVQLRHPVPTAGITISQSAGAPA